MNILRSILLAVVCLFVLAQTAQSHYDPNIGRWISRDPIAERGGLNLYGFLGNDGVAGLDPLGREEYQFMVAGTDVQPEGGADETKKERYERKIASSTPFIVHVDLYYGKKTQAALLVQGFAHRDLELPKYDKDISNRSYLKVLKKSNEGVIAWGGYKDTKCNCATDAMLVNCLLASPNPKCAHSPGTNDCQTDIQHAIRGCCLTGYEALGKSWIGTTNERIKSNYIENPEARDRKLFEYNNKLADPVQRLRIEQ